MKKFLTVMLAAIMIMALAATTFADGENPGSITVTNPLADQTYAAYQMATLDHYENDMYTYTVLDAWKAFFQQYPDDFAISDEDKLVLAEGSDLDADAFAKEALAYAEKNDIDPTATGTLDEGETTIVMGNLPLGYYLVDSSVGAFCGLTNTKPNGDVREKNSIPTVDKTVEEDSNNEYDSDNDADFFQTINYKTVVTARTGAMNYVLHDKMDAGLTWGGTVTVTVGEDTITAGNDTYTLVIDTKDDCTFEIVFADAFVAGLDDGTDIIVEYTATLNENAKITITEGDENANENDTWLEYGDAKNTTIITTQTRTYKFDFVKTDVEGNLIDGAKFKLYNAATDGDEIKLTKVEDGVYRVADTDDTVADVIETKDGKATVIGLDGTTNYYLEETEAPAGYNKLTAREEVELGKTSILTVKNDETGKYDGVQIINKTGSILPETGGLGTVLFVLIGGAVILGAGVLLFAKVRMAQVAE